MHTGHIADKAARIGRDDAAAEKSVTDAKHMLIGEGLADIFKKLTGAFEQLLYGFGVSRQGYLVCFGNGMSRQATPVSFAKQRAEHGLEVKCLVDDLRGVDGALKVACEQRIE